MIGSAGTTLKESMKMFYSIMSFKYTALTMNLIFFFFLIGANANLIPIATATNNNQPSPSLSLREAIRYVYGAFYMPSAPSYVWTNPQQPYKPIRLTPLSSWFNNNEIHLPPNYDRQQLASSSDVSPSGPEQDTKVQALTAPLSPNPSTTATGSLNNNLPSTPSINYFSPPSALQNILSTPTSTTLVPSNTASVNDQGGNPVTFFTTPHILMVVLIPLGVILLASVAIFFRRKSSAKNNIGAAQTGSRMV